MAEGGLETAVPSREELVRRAAALVEPLAARAGETERLRRLHPDTVGDLRNAGLWGVHRPFRYGGSEGDFGLIVDIGEQLGRACPSTAWVWVNLVSHNWMLGMWPERAQDAVWGANPDARIGSATVYPPGRAVRVDGGYLLSGRWPFSSGIEVSHWVMLGGMMPPEDGDGPPKPHIFVVDCANVEVIDTWDVVGLVGTGSHDVACENVFVPDYMALSPHDMRGARTPGSAVNPASLYRLPLLGMFSHILAGAMLGAARGALDHYTESMRTRVATFNRQRIGDHAAVQLRIAEAAAVIRATRQQLRDGPREAHAIAEEGRIPTDAEKTSWRADAAYACRKCADVVDLLYQASGGAGNYRSNPIQRFFRDVRAGVTHIGVSWDANGAEHGRALLGLPHGNFLL
ncbi:MAG: acyl-CoA dehydrogenase family protein [Defluviicoccus sp.]|nr:acyl-CoA dehydrogenase family protein [Defluviicoccus sp.]MDE0383310.1 acyl-CoA dehydrogenase family protein [Defluviicoccus sp.]